MDQYHILVVDDEYIIRNWIGLMLERGLGDEAAVDKAASGEEAADLLAERSYDIVFTDIRMKRMDGLELISHVGKVCPGAKCILISNYGEFRYAKDAMRLGACNYLLKSEINEQDLIAVTRSVIEEINLGRKEQQLTSADLRMCSSLRRMLDGGVPDPEEQALLLRRMEASALAVVVFEFDDPSCGQSEMDGVIGHVIKNIRLWFPDSPCVRRGDRIVALLRATSTSLKTVRERLEVFCLRCVAEADYPISAGVSPLFYSLPGIGQAYEAALQALELRYFTGGQCVRFRVDADAPGQESGQAGLPFHAGRGEIRELLGLHRLDWAEEKALSLLAEYARAGGLRRKETVDGLKKLYAIFADYRIRSGDGEALSRAARFDEAVERFRLYRDAAAYAREALKELTALCRAAAPRDIVESAIAYIRANYRDDISLAQAAETLHVSEGYLSRRFRQKTGQTFSSYLQQTRIDASKELLRAGDVPITAVCTSTGFSSLSYYAQAFRRSEGISPREWRAKYADSGQKN